MSIFPGLYDTSLFAHGLTRSIFKKCKDNINSMKSFPTMSLNMAKWVNFKITCPSFLLNSSFQLNHMRDSSI